MRRPRLPAEPPELLEAAQQVFSGEEQNHVFKLRPGGGGGPVHGLGRRILQAAGLLRLLREKPDDAGLHDRQKGREAGGCRGGRRGDPGFPPQDGREERGGQREAERGERAGRHLRGAVGGGAGWRHRDGEQLPEDEGYGERAGVGDARRGGISAGRRGGEAGAGAGDGSHGAAGDHDGRDAGAAGDRCGGFRTGGFRDSGSCERGGGFEAGRDRRSSFRDGSCGIGGSGGTV